MANLLTRLAAMQFSAFVPEYGIVNPNPHSTVEQERYAVFPESALPLFAENAWIVLEDGDLALLDAEEFAAPEPDPVPEPEPIAEPIEDEPEHVLDAAVLDLPPASDEPPAQTAKKK
jgi:hypothetical protein